MAVRMPGRWKACWKRACRRSSLPLRRSTTGGPSTWPGSRLPHLFLEDGVSIHEKLGKYFTLINFGDADMSSCVESSDIPLEVLNVDEPHAKSIYQCEYLLVRPDQHIAWRGEELPQDFGALMDKVSGN